MSERDLSTKISQIFNIVQDPKTNETVKRGAIGYFILELEGDAERVGIDKMFEKLKSSILKVQ